MDSYNVTLTGVTPLILHQDNIAHGEKVRAWCKDPANKGISQAGDDRTPAWCWIGYAYEINGTICLSNENILACLRDGGKRCPAAVGRGSMKAQTQSGLVVEETGWAILVDGKPIKSASLEPLRKENDFEKHVETVQGIGFDLLVKRAKIGTSKHVRVRPIFRQWQAAGIITVADQAITQKTLETILTHAGNYCGIGDWRPSSPQSPGQYGRFTADVKKI